MKYQINIKVTDKFLLGLHKREKFHMPSCNEIYDMEKEIGVTLKPVHPVATHPLLIPYFTVQVPDHLNPKEVIRHLKDCKLIESDYIKPNDELPSSNY